MRSWSPIKVLTALALATWAGLFWFLELSGRSSLYLSSRTDWVVPLGGTILTVATIGRLISARTPRPQPIGRKEAWGIGVVVLPVVVVLALPPAALGSFAVDRRSSFSSAGFVASAEDIASGDLSLAAVAGAVRSSEAMKALVGRAGEVVSFTGFVSRNSSMPADEFMLTRFLISCCVADALSVQVRISGAPPGKFKEDEWVRVTGALYPLGQEVVVDASEIVSVPRPEKPYLNP